MPFASPPLSRAMPLWVFLWTDIWGMSAKNLCLKLSNGLLNLTITQINGIPLRGHEVTYHNNYWSEVNRFSPRWAPVFIHSFHRSLSCKLLFGRFLRWCHFKCHSMIMCSVMHRPTSTGNYSIREALRAIFFLIIHAASTEWNINYF